MHQVVIRSHRQVPIGCTAQKSVKKTAALVSLMAEYGLALSVVEHAAFRQFCAAMDHKFVIPSHHHLSTKLIPDAVAAKTAKLQEVLSVDCHVSLTSDLWTDRCMNSFMAITATPSLAEALKGSHTGVRVAEQYEKTVMANNVYGKVDFCLTDNALNMCRAFDVIASFHYETTPDMESNFHDGVSK